MREAQILHKLEPQERLSRKKLTVYRLHISILQVQVLLVQNLTEQKMKDAALLRRVESVDFRTKLKQLKKMLDIYTTL